MRTSPAVYTEREATLADREDWLAARTKQGYPVLVAVDQANGSALGYSTFGDFRPWPGYRHTVEHSVYVVASARGNGLGSALVEPLFGLAAALDKRVMVADIDATNLASIQLHERLGFERVGTLREVGRKFDRWLDLLFMQRFFDMRVVTQHTVCAAAGLLALSGRARDALGGIGLCDIGLKD